MHSNLVRLKSWNAAFFAPPMDVTQGNLAVVKNSISRGASKGRPLTSLDGLLFPSSPIIRTCTGRQAELLKCGSSTNSSYIVPPLPGQASWRKRGFLAASSGDGSGRSDQTLGVEEDDQGSPVQVKDQNGASGALQESILTGAQTSSNDMIKLFNDAQQNMLYLNRQRLMAVEELHKAEREQEFLLARVGQLEAENQAALAERDVLEQRLRSTEATLEVVKNRGINSAAELFPTGEAKRKPDPPSIWSSLLLRIDSMLLSEVVDGNQAQALRELVFTRDHRTAEVYMELQEREDKDLAGPMLGLLDVNRRRGLHVVQVCTELAPVAQAGSLGSWLTGLCRALRKKGHMVEVILPRYAFVDASHIDDFREASSPFYSYFDGEWQQNKIWTGTVLGLPVTFIEPLHPAGFFSRDDVYGYEDDFERFTYFSRAALDWIHKLGKKPDIIHLHNWHTSAAAPLFWEYFYEQGLRDTRVFLTCHNFKYQVTADPGKLALCGLDPQHLYRPDRLQDNQDPAKVNLLKGGIVYSNKVTTVSPTYAADVKTAHWGCGLDATVKTHEKKFFGLPSGVDDPEWEPATDRFLPVPFSAEDLSGKAVARMELRQRLGLPLEDSVTGVERPLVGCVVPLVTEKELDLITAAMDCTLNCGAQFVMVGASKAPRVQAQLEDLQRERTDENAEVVIRVDPSVVHLVVAAADILVCLDFYDPIAQFPLIARKYGTVPVARQLGGASDSIVDVDKRGSINGTGFTFRSDSAKDMTAALQRAIERIGANSEQWESYVSQAMQADCSWDSQISDAYIEAYWSIRRC